MHVRGLLLLSLVLVAGAGCRSGGPVAPKTYPVKGKVVYADGQPYGGGRIELRAEGLLPAMGQIGSDGTFSLVTLFEKGKADGAVEGTFQAIITPPMDEAKRGAVIPIPITVPGELVVKAGEENNFTIQLPGTAPGR